MERCNSLRESPWVCYNEKLIANVGEDMTKQFQQTEWTTAELKQRLDRKERFFLLDVRNRDEFASWKIESVAQLPTLNVPYFEMIEQGGKDDVVECVIAYAQQALAQKLPKDRHYRSLQKLLRLPGSVTVLPGHFSSPREANVQGLFAATLGKLKIK